MAGPKIAICETASNAVFVLNSAFTSKDQYFKTAMQEAILAFNNVLKDFGYTKTLEYYDPNVHILRRNILCFNNLQKLSLTFILLFNCISSSFLHLSSMMHRNMVADHSSKELLLHMLTPFTTPHKMVNIIHPLFRFADVANILLVIVTGLLLTLSLHWFFCPTSIFLFLNLPLHWSFSVAVTTTSTS